MKIFIYSILVGLISASKLEFYSIAAHEKGTPRPRSTPSNSPVQMAEFLDSLSSSSPRFRQGNFRPSSSSSPRWLISSSSLIDLENCNSVIVSEFKGIWDVQRVLCSSFFNENPAIEFLFHKSTNSSDTGFTGFLNYQAANKAAFAAIVKLILPLTPKLFLGYFNHSQMTSFLPTFLSSCQF